MQLTISSKGQNYAPPICGSLRSLYHKWAPLRFAPVQRVNRSVITGGNTQLAVASAIKTVVNDRIVRSTLDFDSLGRIVPPSDRDRANFSSGK